MDRGVGCEEERMPTYVLLSTLTPDGRMSLHKNPGRLEEVNREIEQLGCKVVSQWAVLGPFDFGTVVEAPDNESAAHLSIDLGSRGTVNITTLPAMPIADLRKRMSGTAQIGHR